MIHIEGNITCECDDCIEEEHYYNSLYDDYDCMISQYINR